MSGARGMNKGMGKLLTAEAKEAAEEAVRRNEMREGNRGMGAVLHEAAMKSANKGASKGMGALLTAEAKAAAEKNVALNEAVENVTAGIAGMKLQGGRRKRRHTRKHKKNTRKHKKHTRRH
jgi:hypothetical protein